MEQEWNPTKTAKENEMKFDWKNEIKLNGISWAAVFVDGMEPKRSQISRNNERMNCWGLWGGAHLRHAISFHQFSQIDSTSAVLP